MVKMPKTLEILAPAGSEQQLLAAAACGTDAVYMGGTVLNARRSAANFDDTAMAAAVEYCHVRGIKVHLALNTIVLPREIDDAQKMLQTACAIGIDAIIVQDIGLAELVRRAAPDMPLHASTQMAVHNLAGAQALEALGFSRVVLAREMSRAEIAQVIEGTALETEVFVHGALCMSVSGQCYMSSIIGERSGNRGLCAQPCRLPFYIDQKGACELSLKDLSLVEKLDDLRQLGVTSVKIEGRMKRPEYVAAAVTACLAAREGKTVDVDTLQAVFSRSGFTQGYYNDARGNEMFGTRSKDNVVSADGVLKGLAQLYRKERPRVALSGSLKLRANENISLTLSDEDGNMAVASGECPQQALNKPTTPEMLQRALEKLGGTPYYLGDVIIDCGEGLAMPVSAVNELRRTALESITKQRAQPKPTTFLPLNAGLKAADTCEVTLTGAIRTRFSTAQQMPIEQLKEVDIVILPVAEAVKVTDKAVLAKLVAELPRIDFENYKSCLPALAKLKESGVTRLIAGNLGGVWLAKQMGFMPLGDWGLNITNHLALNAYASLGCENVTASYELNFNDIKKLGGAVPYGIVAHGYLPLMITRNCPVRNEQSCGVCGGKVKMYDRLGNAFTVSCSGGKKLAEIYNCTPLYLADRLPELASFAFITLYFTTEGQEECAKVISEYKHGGEREKKTRGLYYRNLQ